MRMWARSEDSADEVIPAPVGIERILEYSMREPDAAVPEGVTKPSEEDISIRGIEVRGPGETWTRL